MSEPLVDHAGLEILSPEECQRHLESSSIGRLAFFDAGAPTILPVTITMWGSTVVFRTAPGSKLDAAVMTRVVALEVDDFDEVTHEGWSVVVKGTLMPVEDGREIASLDRLGNAPWSKPEIRQHWVQVRADETTGRRIVQS